MLDTIGKFFERILKKRLTDLLEGSRAICDTQYGFRRGRSFIDAIQRLQSIIRTRNEKGQVVEILTLDVSNVFNSAPWEYITEALRKMAATKYLLDIIESYLWKRKILYEINRIIKEFVVERGVPQGFVLGPCL